MSISIDYFVYEFSQSCEKCNVVFGSEFEEYYHICEYCMLCDEYNCIEHCFDHGDSDSEMERWENCSWCKGTGRIPVLGTLCGRCCDGVTYHDQEDRDPYDGWDGIERDSPIEWDEEREPECDACAYGWGMCRSCRNREEELAYG